MQKSTILHTNAYFPQPYDLTFCKNKMKNKIKINFVTFYLFEKLVKLLSSKSSSR